jgi:hypothetical protein
MRRQQRLPSPMGRYPDARSFLEALGRYWGRDGYRTAPGGQTHLAACPACRSKSRPRGDSWRRYPLVVGDRGAARRFTLFASCGCPPTAIVGALLAAERDRLETEIADFGRAAGVSARNRPLEAAA